MDDLPTPTARELEILKVLWDLGPSSVRVVHENLEPADADDLAYNTVQTLLRIMEAKRLVTHHVEGRTFVYTPRFSREESATRFLDHVFDGAAAQLVQCLITAERIAPDELERMHALIGEARRRRSARIPGGAS